MKWESIPTWALCAAVSGQAVLMGTQRVGAQPVPPQASDSSELFRLVGGLEVGGERVLRYTAGDLSLTFGGTMLEPEYEGADWWVCFDLDPGVRLLIGGPDIPGEAQDPERYLLGAPAWVGGPERCNQFRGAPGTVSLLGQVALGDSAARLQEMLGDAGERSDSVQSYEAVREFRPVVVAGRIVGTSGLRAKLEVLVEGGLVTGIRGCIGQPAVPVTVLCQWREDATPDNTRVTGSGP